MNILALKEAHKHSVLKLNFLLSDESVKNNAVDLGNALLALGTDLACDGFWVWDIAGEAEYYSPKFRQSLGFEDEKDFPNVPASWQKQIFKEYLPKAIESFEKHLADPNHEYDLVVEYRKKNKGSVRLVCSGTIVNRGSENLMMLGSHKIIKPTQEP